MSFLGLGAAKMNRYVNWMLAVVLTLLAGVASAAEQLLGPGDVLKISVFGNPDLGLETKVSDSGHISFPLLGPVKVAGMGVSSAEKKLSSSLTEGGFLKNAQVNILVTQLQSQQISVLGQVNRPGRYPVDGKRSLVDMLALAGGANGDSADAVTLVRVKEGQTTKEVVDLAEMIRSGDMSKNLDLFPGDIIFVDRAPKFYIYGEVQRPGAYRLDRGMTVVQALSVSGGLTPRGTDRGIVVRRRGQDGTVSMIKAKHEDAILVDDVISIKESLF